jgi:hypothetical protein
MGNILFKFTELCNLQCHIITPSYLDSAGHEFPAVLHAEHVHCNITFWISISEQIV